MATLCLIHWLRYLIMFWYSTHLISTSCSEKKDHQPFSISQHLDRVEVLVEHCRLTLGLIPSTPSGTLGKASYSVETYVMTDFSSGDWTSTSDEGSKSQGVTNTKAWQWAKKVFKNWFPESNQQVTVCVALTLGVQESGHPQLLSYTKRMLQIRSVGLWRHAAHVNHVRPAERETSKARKTKPRRHSFAAAPLILQYLYLWMMALNSLPSLQEVVKLSHRTPT